MNLFHWSSLGLTEYKETSRMNFFLRLTLIVLSIISLSSAHNKHPYGQPISIQLGKNSESESNEVSEPNFDILKTIFDHPEVENRKVVVLSIIGAYRKGKSFFLDYCLRFLYSNVRRIKFEHLVYLITYFSIPNSIDPSIH